MNDVEANAHGLTALPPGDFMVLNEGTPDAEGNAALISAGTGLGEAGLYFDGRRHRPFASEGGHPILHHEMNCRSSSFAAFCAVSSTSVTNASCQGRAC